MVSGNVHHFWLRCKQFSKKDRPLILKTGISHSTLSTWRKKNTFPRADKAVEIAGALHTTVEYLVTGTETNNAGYPPVVLEIATAASQLTEEGLAMLKSIIASLPHFCTTNKE